LQAAQAETETIRVQSRNDAERAQAEIDTARGAVQAAQIEIESVRLQARNDADSHWYSRWPTHQHETRSGGPDPIVA